MKRITALLLTLFLALSLAACGGTSAENINLGIRQTKEDADAVLFQQGMALIALMAEKAASEPYRNTVSISKELAATLDGLSGDYTAPSAVYRVAVPNASVRLPGASQALCDDLSMQMPATRGTQYNAQRGIQSLAAASAVSSNTAFVCPGVTASTQLLYLFLDGTPVLVTFLPQQDGAVSATAMFLFHEGDDSALIRALFGDAAVEQIR